MVDFRRSFGPLMFISYYFMFSQSFSWFAEFSVTVCWYLLRFVDVYWCVIKWLHQELDEEMCCMVSPVFLVNYMSHPGHLSCRYCRCPLSVASANMRKPISDYNLHCTGANYTIKESKRFKKCLCISWRCTAFFVERTWANCLLQVMLYGGPSWSAVLKSRQWRTTCLRHPTAVYWVDLYVSFVLFFFKNSSGWQMEHDGTTYVQNGL